MKNKKIIFAILIFVFGIAGIFSGMRFDFSKVVLASSVNASVWDGNEQSELPSANDYFFDDSSNKIYIRSAKGFSYFSYLTNLANGGKNFKATTIYLETDIDLNGHEWLPIGTGNCFEGVFDGQGHYVYNLKCSEATATNIALFAQISNVATIKNLHLRNVEISNFAVEDAFVAGLVADLAGGTIESCSVQGKISAGQTAAIGGLVAQASNATISKSATMVQVESSYIAARDYEIGVGGLIGLATGTTISQCANKLYNEKESVVGTSNNYVGGLIGLAENVTISNSYNMASLQGSSQNAGGLIGRNVGQSSISNCYNAGAVEGGTYRAGLVGYIKNVSAVSASDVEMNFTNSFNVGVVNGATNAVLDQFNQTNTATYLYCLGNDNGYATASGKVFYDKGDSISETIATDKYEEIYKLGEIAMSRGFYSQERYFGISSVWDFSNVWAISPSMNIVPKYVKKTIKDESGQDILVTERKTFSYPYLLEVEHSSNANNDTSYSNVYRENADDIAPPSLLGSGTKEDPYQIRTAGDMGYLSFNYNLDRDGDGNIDCLQAGSYFALQNDIDLSGRTWKAIGDETTPFQGVFDGNGFKISGMSCSLHEDFGYHGLFGITQDAVIKNLRVGDVSFVGEGKNVSGVLIAKAKAGTYLINCKNEVTNSRVNAVGQVDSADAPLRVYYGKFNSTSEGYKDDSTLLKLDGLSVEYGYDVTIQTAGGIVYAASGDMYRGEYHILFNADETQTRPLKTKSRNKTEDARTDADYIDLTYGSNTAQGAASANSVAWLPKLSTRQGKTDIIVKKGFKLLSYRYYDKIGGQNINTEASGDSIDATKNILSGLYAQFINGGYSAGGIDKTNAVKISVVYNEYEQRKFDTILTGYESNSLWQAPSGDVYIDYYYEYDSFLGEKPAVFKTPTSNGKTLRSGQFGVVGLYKNFGSGGYVDRIDQTNPNFVNTTSTYYADWRGTSANNNTIKIVFHATAEQFAGNIDFNEDPIFAHNAVSIKLFDRQGGEDGSSLPKLVKVEDGVISADGKTLTVEFAFSNIYSDKAEDYLQPTISFARGYGFADMEGEYARFSCTANRSDLNFGNYFIEGVAANQHQNLTNSQLNNYQFKHLTGDFVLDVYVRREYNQTNSVIISQDVDFAIGPNVLTDLTKVSLVRNDGTKVSLSALAGNPEGMGEVNFGFDFVGKKVILSDELTVTTTGGVNVVSDLSFALPDNYYSTLADGKLSLKMIVSESSEERYFMFELAGSETDSKFDDKLVFYETTAGWYPIEYLVDEHYENVNGIAKRTLGAYAKTDFVSLFEVADLSGSKIEVSPASNYPVPEEGEIQNPEDIQYSLTKIYATLGAEDGSGNVDVLKKGMMTFSDFIAFGKDAENNGVSDISIISEYTNAIFEVILVDENGNEFDSSVSSRLPRVQSLYEWPLGETDVINAFEIDVVSSDYYRFNADEKNGALAWGQNIRIAVDKQSLSLDTLDPSDAEGNKKAFANQEALDFYVDQINNCKLNSTQLVLPNVENDANDTKANTYIIKIKASDIKDNGFVAGKYFIYLSCAEVKYSLQAQARFVEIGQEWAFGDEESDFEENSFKQEREKADIQFEIRVEGENYSLDEDGKGEVAIRFDDNVSIQTGVGDNKGYEFYDWYVVGTDFRGYSKTGDFGGTDLALNAGGSFVYEKYYRLGERNIETHYDKTIKFYAVYRKKQVTISFAADTGENGSAIVLDYNGALGDSREVLISSLKLDGLLELEGKDSVYN